MLKRSTVGILRRHGVRLDRALHNWVYFRFYGPYVKAALVGLGVVDRYLGRLFPAFVARAVFDRYHSKVLAPGDTGKILALEQDLFLGPDEHKRIIPYKYANKILIRNPSKIAVMDCPCKTARKAPCRPVGSCIAVGEDFAPLWLEHCQGNNARAVTADEALEIIRTLRASGHVQQAFLKVGTGGLTGVICNCCPECCVSLLATRVAKKIDPTLSMNAESGYRVRRDEAACQACGACAQACPFEAMTAGDGPPAYDPERCMGCGLCVDACPNKALSLEQDPEGLLPLDLDLARAVLKE